MIIKKYCNYSNCKVASYTQMCDNRWKQVSLIVHPLVLYMDGYVVRRLVIIIIIIGHNIIKQHMRALHRKLGHHEVVHSQRRGKAALNSWSAVYS